jgi:hypothetical protein
MPLIISAKVRLRPSTRKLRLISKEGNQVFSISKASPCDTGPTNVSSQTKIDSGTRLSRAPDSFGNSLWINGETIAAANPYNIIVSIYNIFQKRFIAF